MVKKIKFKHHPGYDYKKGVDWNVKRGLDYAKKHHLSLEDVKKQLNFLANLNKKNKKVSDIYRKASKKVSDFGKKLKLDNNKKKNKKGKIEKEIIDFFKEDKEEI